MFSIKVKQLALKNSLTPVIKSNMSLSSILKTQSFNIKNLVHCSLWSTSEPFSFVCWVVMQSFSSCLNSMKTLFIAHGMILNLCFINYGPYFVMKCILDCRSKNYSKFAMCCFMTYCQYISHYLWMLNDRNEYFSWLHSLI